MGQKLFGLDISGAIKKYIGAGVLPATLIKEATGTRTGGALTSGTNPVPTSYPCRGFIDRQGTRRNKGGLETERVVYITLIGDTIADGTVVPLPNDRITIEGKTYEISGPIDRDPAAATYSCPATLR